jgi:hypothetical protein
MSAVDIYGVFVPALFVMVIIAIGATKLLTMAFARLGIYRVVWHRPLFDLAVFVIALGVVFLLITSLNVISS